MTQSFVTRSSAETQGVKIDVEATYSPEYSDPEKSQWFFLYTIAVRNQGEVQVQLMDRHWIIVDGTGHAEEVRGEGVVGSQPQLAPGDAFEYTSGCPLPTPFGSMTGTFRMVREDGTEFQAEIAIFELMEPRAIH
ncbi:MAG: Co2+/Mg2+ efflux protein ApaG [Deltaproteobacteria bacterium]|nr:Co2+/Mg2+ efflux protein ApaG [Deltaproteobacteria bacterium]